MEQTLPRSAALGPVTAQSWGSETAQRIHPRGQVRHVILRPGQATDPELHFHRSEVWVVIQGTGEAWIDGRARRLQEAEPMRIPAGARHVLNNPGRIDLQLVAIEIGSYLEADDNRPDLIG